jgi:hypothetical protein
MCKLLQSNCIEKIILMILWTSSMLFCYVPYLEHCIKGHLGYFVSLFLLHTFMLSYCLVYAVLSFPGWQCWHVAFFSYALHHLCISSPCSFCGVLSYGILCCLSILVHSSYT